MFAQGLVSLTKGFCLAFKGKMSINTLQMVYSRVYKKLSAFVVTLFWGFRHSLNWLFYGSEDRGEQLRIFLLQNGKYGY